MKDKLFIIATHNQKKLAEIARILAPLGIRAVTDKELGITLPEVEETGQTFLENARLKAQAACRFSGYPAIADDSGLMVDALDGAPGVYSARYSGEGATDEKNNQKLLRELQDIPAENRGAQFVCAICCVFPNGDELTAEGICRGQIGFEPQGSGGFGYDPLFLYNGLSFGELPPDQKDAVSHRGQALKALQQALQTYYQKSEETKDVDK